MPLTTKPDIRLTNNEKKCLDLVLLLKIPSFLAVNNFQSLSESKIKNNLFSAKRLNFSDKDILTTFLDGKMSDMRIKRNICKS